MWKAIYTYLNYSLDSSSTFWAAYLGENSHINAVNLILFSFLLANTQLFSASPPALQIKWHPKWDLFLPIWQAPPQLCQAACIGRIFFLAGMGLGDLYLQYVLNGWPVFTLACPALPSQPFRVYGSIRQPAVRNNCLGKRWKHLMVKLFVKVFCSTLGVPGWSLQVPRTKLVRRQEWWRGNHQEWIRKNTTLGCETATHPSMP